MKSPRDTESSLQHCHIVVGKREYFHCIIRIGAAGGEWLGILNTDLVPLSVRPLSQFRWRVLPEDERTDCSSFLYP